MKKFLIAGILALAVTALLAGCGSSHPSGNSANLFVSGTDSAKTRLAGGLNSLAGSSNLAVRVIGRVVKNPGTGASIILARRVVALQ